MINCGNSFSESREKVEVPTGGILGTAVVIDSKQWHIRPTSQAQNQLIANIDFDVMHWQKQLKTAEIATEAIGENKVLYLANFGSSKQALVLSMN